MNTEKELLGTWTGQTGSFTFNPGGKGIANGSPFEYAIKGNTLVMAEAAGSYQLTFSITGNTLNLMGNGTTISFTRKNGNSPAKGQPGNMHKGNGMELVGKWCYLTSNYNTLGSQSNIASTDECVVINADGTYTYHMESYRSAGNNGSYLSNATQSNDRGTWSYDGMNTLTVNSQTQGQVVYTLEKKNHPKNGDPMIFLNGRGFVTYGPKPGW